MKTRSIKSQLLLWLLIPLVLLSVVKLIVSHEFAAHRSQEVYDELLRNSADSVISRIDYKDGKISIDFPEFAQALFRHHEKDKFWYKINRADGSFILGDRSVPVLPGNSIQEIIFGDGIIDGAKVRVISLPYTISSGEILRVEVAETCNARNGMAGHVLSTQVWLQVLVVAGTVIAVFIGVNRGLAPLIEIHKAIAKRSPFDLRPLEIENPPQEVTPLIDANNQLLQELQNHLDAQKEFASNAAHQLRTPLTGLKTYVSLGARISKDEKVDEIFLQLNNGLNRMTSLVNRLLTLARVEGRAPEICLNSTIDLNALVGDTVSELDRSAMEKGINLEFEPSLTPAYIQGDSESMRELVENIIHNAICYTPKNGEIKASITADQLVVFSVEDTGPGIPQEERDRIFDRFYRVVGSGGEGSGLGLSIVKEIAQTHRAEVTVSDAREGRGCKICVSLPRIESNEVAQQLALTARKREVVYSSPEAGPY